MPTATRADRPPARRSSQRRRLALIVLGCGGGLVGTELLLRVLGVAVPDPDYWVGQFPDRETPLMIPDPEIGWRIRPGISVEWNWHGNVARYVTDDAGFRVDPDAEVAPAAKRIALIGDSNSWGLGVGMADTFGSIVDRALADASVRNFAQPAFGLDQMWLTLRLHALPTKPDLVVVGLIHDDFARSLRAHRSVEGFNKPVFTLENGSLRQLSGADRPGALVAWLDSACHLYAAAKSLSRDLGRYYRLGRWWHLNAAILRAIRQDCAAADVPVVFLLIPTPGTTEFPSLAAEMRETGAHFVDPTRSPPPVPGPHWFPGWHLNVAGHEWMAAALLPVVQSLLSAR